MDLLARLFGVLVLVLVGVAIGVVIGVVRMGTEKGR